MNEFGEPQPNQEETITPERKGGKKGDSLSLLGRFRRMSKWMLAAQLMVQASVVGIETALMEKRAHEEGSDDDRSTIESVENDYLNRTFGDHWQVVDDMNFDPGSREKLLQQWEKSGPKLEGFRDAGLDSTEARVIFSETYPRGWVDTDIDSIEFMPGFKKPMGKEYGIKSNRGAEAPYVLGGTVVRLFEKDLGTMSLAYDHESGHANDWIRDRNTSFEAKRGLLLSVASRFLSGKNVYRSAYVDSIRNDDPQVELYNKVTEYWPEICAAVLHDPVNFKKNHPEDYQLVETWMHQTDPDFDPVQAHHQRQEMLASVQVRQATKNIPPDALPEFNAITESIVTSNIQRRAASKHPTRYSLSISGAAEHSVVEDFAERHHLDHNSVIHSIFVLVGQKMSHEN